MPTYVYECAACGHRLEEFQTMTAKLLRKCPACKAAKLVRQIGPGAGFIFKGTGFYITDYKNKKNPGGDSAEAPAKATDTAKPSEAPKSDSGSKDSGPKDPASPKGDKPVANNPGSDKTKGSKLS